MATRSPAIYRRASASGAKDVTVVYSGLLNGDDGAWFSEPGAVLRCVSYSGTWGTGGSARVNVSGGSGADPRAPSLSGAQLDESAVSGPVTSSQTVTNGQYTAAPFYRPLVTAGDGTTNLTVTLFLVQD